MEKSDGSGINGRIVTNEKITTKDAPEIEVTDDKLKLLPTRELRKKNK